MVPPTPLCQAGADRRPRLTLGPPPWLRGSTATWLPRPPGLARGRLQTRAGGSAGGAKRRPPALVNRLLESSAEADVTVASNRLAARAWAGAPRPPTADESPAACHQVIEGLAGDLPVWIGDRPDQERVGLAVLLRGHPPRVRHPRPLAKLAYARSLIILEVMANDWVMAKDLDDLDGAEGGPQPAEGPELVIVDLRRMTIMPPSRRGHRATPWLALFGKASPIEDGAAGLMARRARHLCRVGWAAFGSRTDRQVWIRPVIHTAERPTLPFSAGCDPFRSVRGSSVCVASALLSRVEATFVMRLDPVPYGSVRKVLAEGRQNQRARPGMRAPSLDGSWLPWGSYDRHHGDSAVRPQGEQGP